MLRTTLLRPLVWVSLAATPLGLSPVYGVTNLATNPGLEDFDEDGAFGDGWGSFGSAGFNAFFGGNGHISLFGDNAGNMGGAFQTGIPAVEGQTYQFDLLNTRIESSFDANLELGFEFFAADDATNLSTQVVPLDTAERLLLPNVDSSGAANGAVFSARATAPVGASFVRPIVRFDDVNFLFVFQPQANVFVFNIFVSEVPAPGGNLLKNPGFGVDVDANGSVGDVWGSFGNAEVNAFFGDNVHASLFANTEGNSGGFFQQSILADDGAEYRFTLDDVRIEENFDADLVFGLEYYGSDDFTKLGEDLVTIDTSSSGDGLAFTMTGTPVAGTVYVRPVFTFDNVNESFDDQSQANAFVFSTSLVEVAGLQGDYNDDGTVDAADYTAWRDAFELGGPLANEGASPGVANNADLAVWAAQYGQSLPLAVAVPEPVSLTLLATVAIGVVAKRRV